MVKSANLDTALFVSPAIICASGAHGMSKAYNTNHRGLGASFLSLSSRASGSAHIPCANPIAPQGCARPCLLRVSVVYPPELDNWTMSYAHRYPRLKKLPIKKIRAV